MADIDIVKDGLRNALGKAKWIVLIVVLFLGLMLFRSTLLTWKIIEPGYTGIKINRLVNRSVTREDVVTGFVFYNPIQSTIVTYPAFIQRVAWTHDQHEGAPINEELTFNTKDSVPVNIDVAVSYQIDQNKIPDFYMKFRADEITTFTHGFFRDTTRNIVAQLGSEYNFDEINGAKKEEFLSKVGKTLGDTVKPYGVLVQQFGLIGSLRPPQALLEAVNMKTQAIQKSIQVENELRQAEGEARKAIAKANGEAAANRALAASIDPKLLEWKKLQIADKQVDKWDGKMPSVMGAGNMMMMLPAPSGK